MTENKQSDCTTCAPDGIRSPLSFSELKELKIIKLDFKSAFIQTEEAERDVCVIPPTERSGRKRCLWLLPTTAYELVNAHAKFRSQSDEVLRSIWFVQYATMPQFFYIQRCDGSATVTACKLVDDILIAGDYQPAEDSALSFGEIFELGTTARGPGRLRFFGLNVVQEEDFAVSFDAEDKLDALQLYQLSRISRKQGLEPLNAVELRSYRSLSSSIGW